jgi:diacylglycerol kinase family enzyme
MRALIVLNPHGGSLATLGIDRARQQIAARCQADNLDATIAIVPGKGIADRIRSEIAAGRSGAQSGFDTIVVGGGDGSVQAAASVLAGSDLPLGILPLGTLNHFARDLGLPLDLETALRVVTARRVGSVDVGEVNGHVFVNNSSLGIYPHLVAERERYRRHGPARWLAAALAIGRVLWRLPRPRVHVLAPRWQTERRTTCLFIANNMYRLDGFAIGKRTQLDGGDLCLYMVKSGGRLALLQLAMRAFFSRLEPDRDFVLAQLKSVDISAHRRRLRVALDGESLMLRPPLHYRIRPRALRVIVPEPTYS